MGNLSKQHTHEFVVAGLLRETFTSVDYSFKIDISKIREMVLADPTRWPTRLIPIDEQVVAFLTRVREIDPDRVLALTSEQMADPIFVATFEDGKEGVCPIDGHHRMIRLALTHELPCAAVAYMIPWQELPRSLDKLEIEWGNRQVDLKTKAWRNDTP